MKLTENPVIFEASFYQTIVREILNDAMVGNFMSALIFSLCTIDYMSVPIALPVKNTNTDFKKFLNDYMSNANTVYSNTATQDIIYAIRCSMVHVFGTSDATTKLAIEPEFVIESDNTTHLSISQNIYYKGKFFLSLPHFYAEVIAGVSEYFKKNRANLATCLSDWTDKLLVLSGASGALGLLDCIEFDKDKQPEKVIYANIHQWLDILDDPSKTAVEIREYIADKILKQHNY